jgi:competence protein ComEC
MTASRLALPAGLGGIACGILLAERTPAGATALVVAAAVAAVLAMAGFGLGSRAGATLTLVGIVIAAGALGAWRQTESVTAGADRPSVAALADTGEHDLTGTIVDDPRPREERMQVVVNDLAVSGNAGSVRLADRLLLWIPRGIAVAPGDDVRFTSAVRLPRDFDSFAYRDYLARQRIGAIAEAHDVEVVRARAGVAGGVLALRQALLHGLNRVIPEPQAALGAGILLGVRSAIAPEINEAFERAGLTHVVAISGWNIAIVAAVVGAAGRPLERRAGRVAGGLLVAATVAGYVVLTGATPSVVRAALMAGAILVARLGGSPAHAASALGFAALLMLVAAPSVLWDIGFQLSLLATAGLVWFGAPVERRLARWPGLIREPVALTLAAQITTLPVILVNFERLSLVAPIANVLVVPLVPLAMLFSALAAAVGVGSDFAPIPIVTDVARWLAGGAAWLTLTTMVALGTAAASVPWAAVDVSVPAPFAIAWLPIAALAAWALGGARSAEPAAAHEHGRSGRLAAVGRHVMRPVPIGVALALALAFVSAVQAPDGRLHVTILDIGQGDAILVEAPSGATMLVDGGPDPDRTLRRLGGALPFHHRTIDVLVLTHPHQDHVAGLVSVVDRYEVGMLLHAGIPFDNPANAQLMADVADGRVSVTLARAGQTVWLDAVTSVEIVYPTDADAASPLPDGDINNGSVVAILRMGAFAALLTGDAEAPIEAALLARGTVPDVDVLKVGHHGSESSTTAAFLEAARPEVAVISAGLDNEYGHPARATLETLGTVAALSIFRTDLDGDVEVETDGMTYRVRTAAGWGPVRAVASSVDRAGDAGSIGPCQSPTAQRHVASSPTPACQTGSSSTPRASPAWHRPPLPFSPRRGSRSMARSSKRLRCCTTSTRSRRARVAESTGSSGRGASRPPATASSPCRSPPTRSPVCSTTTAFRGDGRRSSSRWPTSTSGRSS